MEARAARATIRIVCLLIFLNTCQTPQAGPWPAWRGPHGTGFCEEQNLPVKWSATENVRWRVALPEAGNSTPIISGGRIFVTQPVGNRRMVLCFRRGDGQLLWQSGVATRETEPTHRTNPHCSASPVTDGERIIANFASDGLYCYDFEGKELWRRTDLGRQIHIWGSGASPVISGDLCYLNFGPGAATYLLAVNKKTGETVWRREEASAYQHPQEGERPDRGKTYVGSWSTPVLMKTGLVNQLLMSWPNRLAAYDPDTGEELWTCDGLNPLCYTSPIFSQGIVVAMGGFNGMSLAVRAGGSGDITETRRLWHHPRTSQRIGSGVIHEGHIYIHNDPNRAECFELETGRLVWEERLMGPAASSHNWSSIVLASGRCYSVNFGGDCFVFKASPQFELLAVNSLGEPVNSSVAPSDGELFIRTHAALWCIREGESGRGE